MHFTNNGTLMGLHQTGNGPAIPAAALASDQGGPFAIIKSVDVLGTLIDAKKRSPRSIRIARLSGDFETGGDYDQGRSDAVLRALAKSRIDHILAHSNNEEREAVDYWEVYNELRPHSVAGYLEATRLMVFTMEYAEAAGLKVCLFSFNAGTPEWDEILAILKTGVMQRMIQGGHIWACHEGLLNMPTKPGQPERPDRLADSILGVSIPGSPFLPDANDLVFRYRFWMAAARLLGVPLAPMFISEYYPALDHPLSIYGPAEIVRRYAWVDAQLARDVTFMGRPFVLGFTPFGLGGSKDWNKEDHIFALPQLVEYAVSVRDRRNGVDAPAPEPPPVPVPSTCLVGLHGRADGRLQPADLELVRVGRIEAVKLLTTAAPEDVDALRAINPDIFLMVRLYADFSNRRVTPAEFATWLAPEMAPFYQRGLRHYEIHNEPNLIKEGLGKSWNNGAGFAAWFIDVRRRLRQAFPQALFGFPGLSPGATAPGVRQDMVAFLTQAAPACQEADWLGAHAYWQNEAEMSMRHGGLAYQELAHRYPDAPLYITEFSNQNRATGKDAKGREYVRYYASLKGVRAAFSFVASASNQDEFGHECWRDESGAMSPIVALVAARNGQTPAPKPALTNQQVLNIVGCARVGRMPHDLLQAMIANRQAPYTGPSPLDWGLSDEDKRDIASGIGLANVDETRINRL